MYIQLKNNPESPVLISRRLFKAMGFKGRAPWFVIVTRIKGTDAFAIVPVDRADTFRAQCCMVTPSSVGRRTPALFHWTIPSLHYFMAVTGMHMTTGKILKVEPIPNTPRPCFKICTD